jgi:hypothetical protein
MDIGGWLRSLGLEQYGAATGARRSTIPTMVLAGFQIRKMTNVHTQTSAIAVGFLEHALANGALDVAELEAMARKARLLGTHQRIQHAKAFKNAKKSLGIESVRASFGCMGKWAWLLPAKPIKPANDDADRPRDATTCEQVRSVVVNLNGFRPSRASPSPNHLYSIVFCHRGAPPTQLRPS